MTSLARDENMVDELRRILKEKFGHQKYKNEIQRKAVQAVAFSEQDVFISMPTGAGKSLCYQLPALCSKRNGVTIVVSPLIALMMNQLQQMRLLGIPSETINSTMPKTERERVQNDLCGLKPTTKLLYVTPEQLATNNFRAILDKMYDNGNLARVAVDEAHCVSQWGHDFRSDYLRLCEIRLKYPSVPWLALTATASQKVVDDALFLLKLKSPVVQFRTSTFRPNLYYDVVFKECIDDPYEDLKFFALSSLGKTWENTVPENRGCGIIYCRTRGACEEVAMKLTKLGLLTKAYHAGLKSKDRTSIQDEWMAGQVPVIAATVSFGMGVDKSTVRFVIHWAVAQSLAAYYQESGRAGRDGKPARCRIYYSRSDRESILFLLNRDMKMSKSTNEKLKAKDTVESFHRIMKYCEEAVCRHMSLAKEFGDNMQKCKEHCDVCCKVRKVEKKLLHFQSTLLTSKVGNKTLLDNGGHGGYKELYGGGRRGIKRDTDEYGYGSSSDEESDIEKNTAKQLKIFINDEFKRRKKNKKAARTQNIEDSSMVLKASSNLIPEMTVDTRAIYLSKLQEELNAHYRSVERLPTLNNQDLLDCASSHELYIFSTKGNIYMYRREMIQLFRSLRDFTRQGNLHPLLSDYDPSQCTAKQERQKEKKPKERLYTLLDMIPKMEEKIAAKKNKANGHTYEANSHAFNETNTSIYENENYWISDFSEPKKPKAISFGSDNSNENRTNLLNTSVINEELSPYSDCSSEGFDEKQPNDNQNSKTNMQQMGTVPDSRPVIKYFFENPELQENESPELQEMNEPQQKIDNFEISEETYVIKENSRSIETNSELKPQRDPRMKRRHSNRKSNGKQKHHKSEMKNQHKSSEKSFENKSSNSANLRVAADFVRKFLDPKYKQQKITKELFKIACRKISHKLVDSNTINEEAAEMAVKKLFCQIPVIKSESDLIDV